MSIWRLIWCEIRHRKFNFLVALLSVSAAVTCLVAAAVLLEADQAQTSRIVALRQAEVKKAGEDLEESMRKITKGLGFNILILPREQDLNELHLEGTLSRTMPAEYVSRLAGARIVTINHVLPVVVRKLTWPEQQMPIILTGVRGEVPMGPGAVKQPILESVGSGQLVLGYEIHRKLKLAPGSKVKLLGEEFAVSKCHEQRGTAEDSTVWINLAQAQRLLGLENLVHAIFALECQCAADRVAQIRSEITGLLPGTQVIERGPPALARAEARNTARQAAVDGLRLETEHRAKLRRQRERVAATLVPVVLFAAGAWVGLLALANVRQRRPEIGILRALGYRSWQLLLLFLGKALLVGMIAGAAGCGLGVTVGWLAQESGGAQQSLVLPSTGWLVVALCTAVLLPLAASWLPALLASRADPARILHEE